MLTVNSVSKSYRSFEALHEVSFTLQLGDVVGLLGLNGAGKSTLLRGLAGVSPFSSGDVRFGGYSSATSGAQFQKLIGFQPERSCLAPTLTIHQQISTFEDIHKLPKKERAGRRKDLLSLLELTPLLHVPCGELSKGELQRVGFLLATIHSPKLLLLDEPMSGLDPKQMVSFRKFIRAEREKRITIFSTHLLQEVHAVCNKLLVLNQGTLTAFKEELSGESIDRLERYFLHVVPDEKRGEKVAEGPRVANAS